MKKIITVIILSFIYAQTNDLFFKASLALKAGLYNDALKHISDSKEQKITNPEIYKIEGLIHEALNNRVNAIIAWKNCLKYSDNKEQKEECKIHLNNLSIE
tara:strand:- start:2849 stop:3151 length:303 start_codon:yes stop_codon:yes gene_type:complete